MCFVRKSGQRRKKATEDILAFKRLRIQGDDIISPYIYTKWKVGELKKADMQQNGLGEIEQGLHCYVSEEIAVKNWGGCTTVPVIIPKGAHYYINDKEIVSNQMIVAADKIDSTLETIKFLISKRK